MRPLWLTLLALALPLAAQPAPPTASEVHQLFLADQCDRGDSPGCPKSASDPDTQAHDTARRARLLVILAEGKLVSAADFHDAAFLFQHGSQPDDYLLAHILATAAVAKGDEPSRWISAATLDRFL